jgi:CheY-like chemotaxis protein
LAGGIAHDFNNILTILFGNIATAKARLDDPEEAKSSLDNAEKAFHRASYLTNQLLTFAKGGDPVKEELNLAKLVRETVTFDLSGSTTKLEMRVANDLWLAQVDRGQVAQVFSNLTINADQAMPNGGCLFISLDNRQVGKNEIKGIEAGHYILARIKDEGVGIHSSELAKIFDPYYSTKQAGSGLGLATVYSIITRHSGHISVFSTPGEGTVFEILLPASLANPTEVPKVKVARGVNNSRDNRILVMDDEAMICELAERILEREGYEVDTAKNGEEALDLVQKALAEKMPYDCIIMDLTIPGGMGGKEAVKKVLELDPGAKVIVSSGYAVDPVMANFPDYGFKGVITKPFTIKAVSDEVERLLE